MSSEHGSRAIFAALGANVGIAIAKFVAFMLTGSASMLTEGIHSIADSANQVLLLIGGRRSKQQADERHNFGYGRRRYVYGFIVAILLFSVGGVFSLVEGVHKWQNPEVLNDWWIAVSVLVVAIVLEGASFRVALRESKKTRGKRSLLEFIRETRKPELPVILMEDFGAMVGLFVALACVGLTVITGNGQWDAVGAMCIGTLLVLIAVFLGAEMSAMLVGESALPEETALIAKALEESDGIEEVLDIKTMHLGPDELLVAAKVTISQTDSGETITEELGLAEQAVMDAVPNVTHVYLDIEDPDDYDSEGNEIPSVG